MLLNRLRVSFGSFYGCPFVETLSNYQRFDLFHFQTGVLAEFLYRYKFILELIKLLSYVLQQSNALTVTLASYALYVFGVDA
jgi:hypothetical protein